MVGVGVSGIVSDYCHIQNDRDELFFKIKKFLGYQLYQFIENTLVKGSNQRHP